MAKFSFSKSNSKREPKSPLGRLNKLLLFSVAILIIFEALITNAKASNGSKLADLQVKYEALNAEVASIELEVASYSSLSHIKHYASEDLQMETIEKNVLYLPFVEEVTNP